MWTQQSFIWHLNKNEFSIFFYFFVEYTQLNNWKNIKGVLHPSTLFLKTLYIFSKNKATLDKVSYESGFKYSKELKKSSLISVETMVVKLL